jgi:HD-GYP domain-containing protein (c-di-GMP phosphodiesterase class II)
LIRWKRTNELTNNDIIAEKITGSYYEDVVVNYGEVVNDKVIQRLNARGIQWVSVFEKNASPLEPSKLISEEKIEYFENEVTDVYEKFVKEKRIDIEKTKKIGKEISEQIAKNYGEYIWPTLSKLKRMDDYTFTHQVNVAIIASTLAYERFGGDMDKVDLVTASGLLHDVGKLWIPPEILKSRERLPDMEFNIIKKHPKYGHGIAILSGLEDTTILNGILYHHERWDGTGYLEGRKKESIPLEARLIMISDIYDALTTVRPYKPAWSPYDATTFLIRETGKILDPEVVNLFLKVFGLYPVGTRVLLSNGIEGVVVGNKTGTIARPLVKLDDTTSAVIDLFRNQEIMIKQVIVSEKSSV